MAICYQVTPVIPVVLRPTPTFKPVDSFRCNLSLPSKTLELSISEPEPVFSSVKTFAPATVANLGPGFDFLGCAVDGLGDSVSLPVDSSIHPGQISISHISGDPCSKLSRNPIWNCAGIAAIEVMKIHRPFSLSLHKGLPLGSGLGSSAASAAAATVAVNEIFGGKLGSEELVLAGLKSEEKGFGLSC